MKKTRNLYICCLIYLALSMLWIVTASMAAERFSIPIGPSYHGPKSRITVKSFTIAMKNAPQELADGFKDMLETALFESNYFQVIDRDDVSGMSAEQLLSDEILKNPDAILKQKKVLPADILIYGAVTDFEGGGWGVVFKIPGAPVTTGGAYRKTRIRMQIRAVDAASGKVLFSDEIEGTAYGTMGMVGTVVSDIELPVQLTAIKNTPMELAVRDCIYRVVMKLCSAIPRSYFRYQ